MGMMPNNGSYPSRDHRNVQLDINSGAPMAFPHNDRMYDLRNASPMSREWQYSRNVAPRKLYPYFLQLANLPSTYFA